MLDSSDALEGEALRCWSASLRLLGRSDKTVLQLQQSLLNKGFTDEVVNPVVSRLLELGYLNDERYAAAFVRTYSGRLGLGQLKRKLRDKGVADHFAEQALSEYANPDQEALAVEIAQKRMATLRSLPPATAERRLVAFLLRRGFSAKHSWGAVRAVQRETKI